MNWRETQIDPGATVEAADGPLGTVEEVFVSPKTGEMTHLVVRRAGTAERLTIPASAIAEIPSRFTVRLGMRRDELHGMASGAQSESRNGAQIRVPVLEERLMVEKRPIELGEIRLHKTVETFEEIAHQDILEEDVKDRPVATGDMPDAFKEGTIRVPVRGEEAVVTKEAFVTGEVVIDRERTTETQTISDTVRKERVEVDENYTRQREDFRKHFEGSRQGATATKADTRTFDDAEPNYRTGFYAANDEKYRGRKFDDVEPDLRRQHTASSTKSSGTAGSGTAGSGDSWEHLRQEIREGWERGSR